MIIYYSIIIYIIIKQLIGFVRLKVFEFFFEQKHESKNDAIYIYIASSSPAPQWKKQ